MTNLSRKFWNSRFDALHDAPIHKHQDPILNRANSQAAIAGLGLVARGLTSHKSLLWRNGATVFFPTDKNKL